MQRTGGDPENEASFSSGARQPCSSQPTVASRQHKEKQPKPIAKNNQLINSDKFKEKEHRKNESTQKAAVLSTSSSINYWHYKQTGIKSRPIKLIRHPIEHLERKIFLNYFLAFLFKLIAIASGPLIVLVVFLITVPFILVRRAIWLLLNLKCTLDAKISTGSIIDERWNYCPLDHVEAYWFKEKLVNSAILVINNYQKNELSIEQLRKLVRQNILSKSVYRKFSSRVVAKGLPCYQGYYWQFLGFKEERDVSPTLIKSSQSTCDSTSINSSLDTSVDQFSVTSIADGFKQPDVCIQMQANLSDEQNKPLCIEEHIYLDDSLLGTNQPDQVSIRRYVYQLLKVQLNLNRPLWEIRLLPAGKKKSFIVFRCHQSLADGKSLTKMLSDHLTTNCDQLNVKSCRVSLEPPESCSAEDSKKKHDSNGDVTIDLKPVKEKPSFIARVSRSSGMKSAILVGPLTILLWVIWTFTRRRHNHLNRSSLDTHDDSCRENKRFYMTYYDLTKFHQIKQMTRSTVTDVILCAFSGSLREYLRKFNSVPNPPNLNLSLLVDMKQQLLDGNKGCAEVNCIPVNVPLPTSIEGTVPRLWKIRNTMEELRTSADPWVMLGLQQVTFSILPLAWYQWLINHIALGNSSAFVSNLRGPQNVVESWCIDLFQKAMLESQQPPRVVHQEQFNREQNENELEGKARIFAQKSRRVRQESRLRLRLDNDQMASISAIYYCMQPPADDIPISFNCITYHDKLFVTTLTKSLLAEDSKIIIKLFFKQLNQLAETIAKRRSLVSIVRTPVPVEINCQPASPLLLREPSGNKSILNETDLRMTDDRQFKKLEDVGANENSEDDEDDEIMDNDEEESKGVVGHSKKSHKDATIKLGSDPDLNKCKTCEKTVCSCKRRRSLFNFDHYSRHPGLLTSLLTPIQLLVSKKGTQEKRFEPEEPSDDVSTNECMCGQLLLQELDKEGRQDNNDTSDGQDHDQDKEVSSIGSAAHSDDYSDMKQNIQRTIGNESCNKCGQVSKQSSLSLSASNVGTNKRNKVWSTSKLSNRYKTTTNSSSSISNKNNKSTITHCSTQLTVPSSQSNKFQSRLHSKSETDLLPVDGTTSIDTSKRVQQSVSKESWYAIKKFSIFSKPTSHQQQRKVSSRASDNQLASSSARHIFDFRIPDPTIQGSTIRKASSKRRQSVATTTGAPHYHRSVVVKDEINADVSLRYQLDGPPLFGIRTRRFSTIGNSKGGKQRRSSLIPFGLIQNQNLPKFYLDHDNDVPKTHDIGQNKEAHV